MQTPSEVKDSFRLLLLATLITVALWFIPFADVLTYPLRLFVTFIHETGHAIAALATLGSVNRIALFWNGSGVTETIGGARLLISSAGYLSTTIYGSVLLLFLRRARNARGTALGTAIILLIMTVFFAGNLLAWMVGVILGLGCLWLAMKGKQPLVHLFMSFLAVQCLLNAFYDLRTLMYISALDSSRPTDAYNMSEATGGFIPAMVWAVGWSVLSMIILAITLVVYYKSLKSRASLPEMPVTALIDDHSFNASSRQV